MFLKLINKFWIVQVYKKQFGGPQQFDWVALMGDIYNIDPELGFPLK